MKIRKTCFEQPNDGPGITRQLQTVALKAQWNLS